MPGIDPEEARKLGLTPPDDVADDDGSVRSALERVFDLPSGHESAKAEIEAHLETLDDDALEAIRNEAMATFRVLVETALGSEPRYADRYLEPAAKMLSVALDAVRADRKSRIDRAKLEIDRAKLELASRQKDSNEEHDNGNEVDFDAIVRIASEIDEDDRDSPNS